MTGILVTRALPQAEETARIIASAGLVPILAPLREVVTVDAALPPRPNALIVTSANAFAGPSLPASWHPLPLHCVGETTAAAARAAGFTGAVAGPGTAEGLVTAVLATHPPGTRLVYLAGEPRRDAVERLLGAAGLRVEVALRYRMRAVPALPETARTALTDGSAVAILHFSAESATTFFALAEAAGLAAGAGRLCHLCLSGPIAEAVRRIMGSDLMIATAPSPDHDGIVALLATLATDLTQRREIG